MLKGPAAPTLQMLVAFAALMATWMSAATTALEASLAQILQLAPAHHMAVNLSLASFTFTMPQAVTEPADASPTSVATSPATASNRQAPTEPPALAPDQAAGPVSLLSSSPHRHLLAAAAAPQTSSYGTSSPLPQDPFLGLAPLADTAQAGTPSIAPQAASGGTSSPLPQDPFLGLAPLANTAQAGPPSAGPSGSPGPQSTPTSPISPADDASSGGDGGYQPTQAVSSGQTVLQAVVVVSPPSTPGGVSFTAATAERLLDGVLTARAAVQGMTYLEVLFVGRQGVCGNAICEVCLII
ncbi:hypothetical protein WJX84_005927 [Apatococcus fuscideae]|uniref:Uncharacterized protein n=1 Tax=Apatococcus fuscideae TaxID=2026836 RepID=A0AAW1TDZ8_9CHLO